MTSQSAFIAYKICAQAARVKCLEVPMTSDLRFDLKAMAKKLKGSSGLRLVFIANPNNPTGTYVAADELNQFLHEADHYKDVLIVLDEAYCEYVTAKDYPQSLNLLKKYERLAIVRTLSKAHALAGLRVGVLIARPEFTDLVHRVRNPFNVNSLAQVAAIAALDDHEFLRKVEQLNRKGLEYFYAELDKMKIQYWRSQGNFLLFDCGRDAEGVYEALLKKGVIMRPVKGYGLPHCLRLSVGLPDENTKAIQSLREVLKGV